MRDDPEWHGPTVVLGADVVGEGEHKIMAAIREGRASGEMGEETRHCMYGLDADLIMLGLVTHAPKFCLLRERQKFQKGRLAPRARAKRARTTPTSPTGIMESEDVSAAAADDRDFIFLEVELLRELLGNTLRPDFESTSSDASTYEGERIVDDFVFMCMLVGNDFLPGLPHLSVADGALNLMLSSYKELRPLLGGYLTDKARVHLPRLELYFRALAQMEPAAFQRSSP